jgi:hypothetical protein
MKGLRYSLLIALTALAFNSSVAQQSQAPADVRVLIDVSGSMRENDPNNLRQSALQLLVNLLPADATGGVWTFGQWVNMVIKPTPVDSAWRDQAIAQSKQIASRGLYTNIGGALDNASFDFKYSYFDTSRRPTSVILLTDGMVDIDKNPAIDAAERARILSEVVDKYVAAGVKIHTVALSDQADRELLQTLSQRTDGQFSIANSADELSRIFLRTFDNIVPATEVAIKDNRFVIDGSINEFTALVFRSPGDGETGLIDPNGRRVDANNTSSGVRWYAGSDYDLITVDQPLAGLWQIDAPEDDANRVSIVSNLSMRISGMPNAIEKQRRLGFSVDVLQQGEVVSDQAFLDLLQVSGVAINVDTGDHQSLSITRQEGGRYFFEFSPAYVGKMDIQMDVMAKTFDRRQSVTLDVSPLFSAEQTFDDTHAELVLTAYPVSDGIDTTSFNVDVITTPRLADKESIDILGKAISWRGVLDQAADYQVEMTISGQFNDGSAYSDTVIVSSITSPGVFVPEVVVPKPVAKPAPVIEEGLLGLSKKHTIYAAVGLGNVVLLLLAVWAYRRFMGGKEAPETDATSNEASISEAEGDLPPATDMPEGVVPMGSLDDLQAVDIEDDSVDPLADVSSIDDLLSDDELYDNEVETDIDSIVAEAEAELLAEAEQESPLFDAEMTPREIDIPEVFDDSLDEELTDAMWGDALAEQQQSNVVADDVMDDISSSVEGMDDLLQEEALSSDIVEPGLNDLEVESEIPKAFDDSLDEEVTDALWGEALAEQQNDPIDNLDADTDSAEEELLQESLAEQSQEIADSAPSNESEMADESVASSDPMQSLDEDELADVESALDSVLGNTPTEGDINASDNLEATSDNASELPGEDPSLDNFDLDDINGLDIDEALSESLDDLDDLVLEESPIEAPAEQEGSEEALGSLEDSKDELSASDISDEMAEEIDLVSDFDGDLNALEDELDSLHLDDITLDSSSEPDEAVELNQDDIVLEEMASEDDIPELDDIVSDEELQDAVSERSAFEALGDDLDDLSLTKSGFTPAAVKSKAIDFSALDDSDLDAALNEMLTGAGITEAELDKFEDLVSAQSAREEPAQTQFDPSPSIETLASPGEALEDLMAADLANDLDFGEDLPELNDDDALDIDLGDLDDLLDDLDNQDKEKK